MLFLIIARLLAAFEILPEVKDGQEVLPPIDYMTALVP